MFRHSDTAPLVLSPVDSEPETEMIDNKNADKLAFKYNKSFSDFSFSPFRKQVTRSPALLEPPSLPGGQGHRSCPDLASLPRAQADSVRVKLLGQGRDESEDILTSQWGELSVTREGAIRGPVLVTLHDIGLDYKSNFQVFFSSRDMESVLSRFRILHITLPGQGPGAVTLSTDLGPPSLDSLARLTASVLGHYNVTSCVGLGAGLGANVLLRLGIQNNKILDGIILLNATAQGKGWTEWLYHKRINQKELIPANLRGLLQSWEARSELGISRDKGALQIQVLNIIGDCSPYLEANIDLNSKLDPARTDWLKISDCGMVIEERPAKVTEAIKLFLQGLGFQLRQNRSRSNVVENGRHRLSLQLKGLETPLVKMKIDH